MLIFISSTFSTNWNYTIQNNIIIHVFNIFHILNLFVAHLFISSSFFHKLKLHNSKQYNYTVHVFNIFHILHFLLLLIHFLFIFVIKIELLLIQYMHRPLDNRGDRVLKNQSNNKLYVFNIAQPSQERLALKYMNIVQNCVVALHFKINPVGYHILEISNLHCDWRICCCRYI